MPTKHVSRRLELYLDHHLTDEERQELEKHLEICPVCARSFLEARRLASELTPTLQAALGRPTPPHALRYRVHAALETADRSQRFSWPWLISGRLLNAAGTVAVITLLAFGAFLVVRTQLPGAAIPTEISSLQPGSGSQNEGATTTTVFAPITDAATPTLQPTASVGDTLPALPAAKAAAAQEQPTGVAPANQPEPFTQAVAGAPEAAPPETGPGRPSGTIAFSFFNPAPGRQVYEIHLIEPAGGNHRLFPLDGVSEPALRWTESGLQLAYRAWSEPTSPRSLLTSDLEGELRHRVGGYWEDAHPDWSPTENRLIFASQRETDRRWRLYTSWGDGLAEKELRREGKSPSFAPDGYHFVFEGCDETGNRCGLWRGDLENSEYNSELLLADPQAQAPDWSPVGEQIAFMANLNDNWDLYLVDQSGRGEVRRLTTDPAIDGLPTWSPDGEWLAFLSNREGNWGIWILQVAGGDTRRVFEFDGGVFTPPAREPYGERNWQDEQLSWSR
ncbi:MAG: zf-HC2 domain-containing protein [Chloroflexota bacterium]